MIMKRLAMKLLSMSLLLALPQWAQANMQHIDHQARTGMERLDEAGLLPASSERQGRQQQAFGFAADGKLTYSPSTEVSTSVRRQLAQRLVASDPEHASVIESTLSSDAVWRGFADAVERNGGSSRNLADVMAAYYVSSWEIVHREEAGAQRYQSVRQQFAAVLTAQPELLGRDDAAKQRQAEDMGIRMSLFSAAARQMLERGDEKGFAAIQDAVRYAVLAHDGIDLKNVQLTGHGLSNG
jgi:hypothetical protein